MTMTSKILVRITKCHSHGCHMLSESIQKRPRNIS